jgi:hypothetical protein
MTDFKNLNEEMSLYINDILKNKDMVKEMFRTNILVYEDKIKDNELKIAALKDEINKISSDFSFVENKLKLDYAKNHDQFKKHEINFKLLEKTNQHYNILIKEREDEIKKHDEQSIYAHQDYQNKKVKLDCLNAQIIEAEFQLKNLNKSLEEKIGNVIDNGSDSFIEEFNKSDNDEINKYLSEKIKYTSSYHNPSDNNSVKSDTNKKCFIF